MLYRGCGINHRRVTMQHNKTRHVTTRHDRTQHNTTSQHDTTGHITTRPTCVRFKIVMILLKDIQQWTILWYEIFGDVHITQCLSTCDQSRVGGCESRYSG